MAGVSTAMRRRVAAGAVAALAAGAAFVFTGAAPALAAAFTVNSNADTNAVNAAVSALDAGGNITLRSAMERADFLGGSNVITFGLPTPSTITLSLGVLAMPNPGTSITITGAGIDQTIIDAHGASSIFDLNGVDTAVLQGMTLKNATGTSFGVLRSHATTLSSLKILNTTVNAATNDDGPIDTNDTTVSNVVIDTVTNTVTGTNSNFGAVFDSNRLTVTNSRITHVTSTNGSGGNFDGLFDTSVVSLTDTTVSNVQDTLGPSTSVCGGLFCSNAVTLTRTNLSSISLSASDSGTINGGIFDTNAVITMDHSAIDGLTIAEGRSETINGGVFDSDHTPVMDHSAIGNVSLTAGLGSVGDTLNGGLADTGPGFSASDSTIAGNSIAVGTLASVHGELFDVGAGGVTLTNVTLAGNSFTMGAGTTVTGGTYDSGGPIALKNTILADTTADCDGATKVTSADHSIDKDGTCSIGSSNGNQSGVDPQLGAFQLNSPGSTKTMAISAGSPALDTANNANCPATDQRDVTRVTAADPVCDIGAYELQKVIPTVPTTGTPATGGTGGGLLLLAGLSLVCLSRRRRALR